MGELLIVSRAEDLKEYQELAGEYDVGFEVNDFFNPEVLENTEEMNRLIEFYQTAGLPAYSTMHGAFFDIVVFSQDLRIREISELRMEQSMKIAVRLGVRGIVFHTNISPVLSGKAYDQRAVDMTSDYLECLLKRYPDTDIYLENMFDTDPDILQAISEKLCVYENYGVCFDYAHASISGTPMDVWVEALAPYIRHIHINDNDLKRDQHLAVGDGKIDWKRFIEYKQRYFEDCSIVIETTLPEEQRRSLEYLEQNFEGFVRRR
ncbi:MAG: sugar phosphate isomerase/epimerase [Lachnospiraceae bacterium]|nr:sugar phosphate isomerase/epimerase [Lachnospiraceae bacterium]